MRPAIIGLLTLAVAACATVKGIADGDTARLERFKALRAERAYAAIAAEEAACDDADGPACRQLHLIRGDACFVLAVAEGEAQLERYECAIGELRAGIDGGPDGLGGFESLQPFEERLLEALRARQDLARSRAEAAPFARELAASARGFIASYPGHPAGYFYGASARLAEALGDVAAGRGDGSACDTLARLLALVEGLSERGAYAANLARLREDVLGARRALPGCAP